MVKKSKRISLIIQERFLKELFPQAKIQRNGENFLTWVDSVTPSPLSCSYKLKLEYMKGKRVSVYVVEPAPLKLAQGKTILPHVYSTEKQKLCLYFPDGKQWNERMLFAKTIIPWACEWLLHYELWVGTGEWHGGGIHPIIKRKKNNFILF